MFSTPKELRSQESIIMVTDLYYRKKEMMLYVLDQWMLHLQGFLLSYQQDFGGRGKRDEIESNKKGYNEKDCSPLRPANTP